MDLLFLGSEVLGLLLYVLLLLDDDHWNVYAKFWSSFVLFWS